MNYELKPQPVAVLCRALAAAAGYQLADPLDEATLLHVPGQSGMAGTYQGRDAIIRLLAQQTGLTSGTLRFAPSRTFLTDDQILVVCGESTAIRRTKRLNDGTAYVLSLREGRVREIWLAQEDQASVDDFWC